MSFPTRSDDWRSLQKYAAHFPHHFGLAYAVAEGLYADSEHTKALKYYKRALAMHQGEALEWGHIAYTFEIADKDYTKAVQYYRKAIQESAQHDTWLHQRLGWCYIQQSLYKEALEVFLMHSIHDPSDSWSHGKIGYCYQMIRDYDNALHYHLKADKMGSTEESWNLGNIGYCYQMLDDYKTAIGYHLRSYDLDPDNIWNTKNVGYCYQKLGDYDKALEFHRKVYEDDPTDVWNVKNVGYCYQQIGNYEKALKYHLLVEKIVPNDTWNLGHIGYCLQRLDRHGEAVDYHKRVYDLESSDTWNKYQLGYCYFTQYNLEGAEFYLQGDDDKYALLHLGSVYLVKGATYQAMEAYRTSIQMFGSFDAFLSVYNRDRKYLEDGYNVSIALCDSIADELRQQHPNSSDDYDTYGHGY